MAAEMQMSWVDQLYMPGTKVSVIKTEDVTVEGVTTAEQVEVKGVLVSRIDLEEDKDNDGRTDYRYMIQRDDMKTPVWADEHELTRL